MSSVTIFWEIVQPLSPVSLWPCQLQKALREHSLRVGMLANRLWLKFTSLLATLVSWEYYSIILETTKNKTLELHAGWFFFFSCRLILSDIFFFTVVFFLGELDSPIPEFAIRKLNLSPWSQNQLSVLIGKASGLCFSSVCLCILEACCLEAVFILETTALRSLSGSEALLLARVSPWVCKMKWHFEGHGF